MDVSSYIWDPEKEYININKHGIDFRTAEEVFKDPKRRIFADSKHSKNEFRLFCVGKVREKVITVRFTYRGDKIRIIGAGYWRKGVRIYEEKEII